MSQEMRIQCIKSWKILDDFAEIQMIDYSIFGKVFNHQNFKS